MTRFYRHCRRACCAAGFILLTLLGGIPSAMAALGDPSYVSEQPAPNALPLVDKSSVATLYFDKDDEKGVARVVDDLKKDIERVTSKTARVVHSANALGEYAVIVGTIGRSQLVDQLIAQGKIDPSGIADSWDAYHMEVVEAPVAGVKRALVIAGANKRGTSYGVYDVSESIGVSPWYYWADVPVERKKAIYILAGTRIQEAPAVKYRGIFLNDEAPALTSWVNENHGNYNHEFYVKVFELLLRLRANFLWPAMWNNAFADDDPQNMILADEYGIVMSTSHHEPMMRADKEWNRYGEGEWEYSTNPENLYEFWVDGAERNRPYESIYTLGMRGQEDKPMSEGENIGLLERIVKDQRKIIEDVFTERDVTEVPQVWCLYKEVQAYYEKGMRVPDDVILLWTDDNWGNIRRLPTPEERNREGGAGVYYHFDYVGGPRSYRWINTVPLAKIWEQMNLANVYDATEIWITNVGDLKPMEYPIEFFLRMAWNPERWDRDSIQEFGRLWATREFGEAYAEEIEGLMTAYTRHNGRRKPELMEPDTYSLLHYAEAERIEQELKDMVARAEALYKAIPKEHKDAFFQLVYFPVKATATVTLMNIELGRNRLYAEQGRANANDHAELAKRYFQQDAELEKQYHSINNGKWNHFMNQPHIGYTNWNNPEGDQMPASYEYNPGDYAEMGIAVEGIAAGWPASVSGEWPHTGRFELSFDQNGKAERWFTVYNRGTKPFEFTAKPSASWIQLSRSEGRVEGQQKVIVSVDWDALPEGVSEGSIGIRGTGWQGAKLQVSATKPNPKVVANAKGFIEADGYLAIEAANFSSNEAVDGLSWKEIEQHGRTESAISVFPVGDRSFKNPRKAPYVEYDVTFFTTGEVDVHTVLAPSWPIVPDRGMRYAVAIGDEKPQIVDFVAGMQDTDKAWEESVKDGVRVGLSKHEVKNAGPNKIRLYMVDPAVTVQKIMVDTGGLLPSYLGPPQSPKR